MNDEIKNILDNLDKIAKGEYYPEDLLSYKECKQLLDYITNLQEENERLKQRIEFKDTFNTFVINKYKSRCEKAIKYINKNILISFDKVGFKTDKVAGIVVDNLLDILYGGDE